MKTEVTLAEVRVFSTPNGNTRYVGRDTDGHEYTTFRDEIGERAKQLQDRRVRIEYHEEQRGRYRNVYLDRIEPADPEGAAIADKLKPFEQRVAEDIEQGKRDRQDQG